jgi:hypothetical protein
MNQFERDWEEMNRIRKCWDESEWRLNFLRSFPARPLTEPTPEQLKEWDKHLKLCLTSPTLRN